MASSDNPFYKRPWRIIPYQRFQGAMNMAVDSYLAKMCKEHDPPILRFYGWQPYCLSLGYHQKSKELNLQKLHENGYEAVRRPTGGSAIFHARELTYSIIVPKPFSDHRKIYRDFHALLERSLRKLGYKIDLHEQAENSSYLNRGAETFACFNRSAFTELTYMGKKLVGSAQKIMPNALLQHGSIMIGSEHQLITDFLNFSDEEKKQYQRKLRQSSCCLDEISDRQSNAWEITDKIVNELAINKRNSIYYQQITENELLGAAEIAPNFKVTDSR